MIVVTGAGGFVGLALLDHLLGEGHPVTAFNDRPLPRPALDRFAALPGALTVIEGDVRDAAALRAALRGARAVVHGAAITLGPKGTIAPAETVVDVNSLSTANLIEAALAEGVGRIVYPSSSAVYGAAPFEGEPVVEDRPPTPAGLYGFTKLMSERLLLDARRRHGLSTVRARITAVFGPYERDTGVRETLSPPYQVAMKALAGEPVRLAAGGARDWTSSRDVARALALLALADEPPHDLYNLSLGETWHPSRLAEAFAADLPGFRYEVVDGEEDDGIAFNDDLGRQRQPISSARFAADFGFRFMPPAEAVADYARWVLGDGRTYLGSLNGA
ncbi:NAD-dependent epimerase/dehydratase family protein [Acuticoccus mangrovi]|uniref:NAD(P)-dependent oxidoreductase n=1 Tax=Acuticoccus mangrovi TaxID=2796142 RepID=A0A934IKP3_9HYPH|nr:NAD(P)-dependent oxidoreductase [Acuticoccus mangrovi]MBJ3775562.1 NAD(P)-dependent oxidoreductase [Acuticoccus mangrovi]